MDEVQQLLEYLASNPNATIRFHGSGMILFIHSNASYLSVAKARSRASGVFFLSDPKPDALTFGITEEKYYSGYNPCFGDR